MTKEHIINLWTRPDLRAAFTNFEQWLPSSPAGVLEPSDDELDDFTGGDTCNITSCCTATQSPFPPEDWAS
jgi:mersacidin/lichenicidin family type 2 lantibiotic